MQDIRDHFRNRSDWDTGHKARFYPGGLQYKLEGFFVGDPFEVRDVRGEDWFLRIA